MFNKEFYVKEFKENDMCIDVMFKARLKNNEKKRLSKGKSMVTSITWRAKHRLGRAIGDDSGCILCDVCMWSLFGFKYVYIDSMYDYLVVSFINMYDKYAFYALEMYVMMCKIFCSSQGKALSN